MFFDNNINEEEMDEWANVMFVADERQVSDMELILSK
jgi:hypothetical protein